MIHIFTIIYIVLGIVFGAIMESSDKPDIIKNNRLVRGIFLIAIMLIWLPYLFVNASFIKRDIWFRKNHE